MKNKFYWVVMLLIVIVVEVIPSNYVSAAGKEKQAYKKDVTSAAEEVTLKNTEGKDASDVAAIKDLLEQLKAQGNDTVSDFGFEDLDEWCYSWSGDGKLIKLTLSIGVYDGGLKGGLVLKGFKNLEELNCGGSNFSELDLGNCPNLKELDCDGNSLTKLDISKFPKLKTLYCSNNKLTKLDISKCPKLKYLSCGNNKLKKLNTKKCPKLSSLYADKKLKISGWHPAIKFDFCWKWERN